MVLPQPVLTSEITNFAKVGYSIASLGKASFFFFFFFFVFFAVLGKLFFLFYLIKFGCGDWSSCSTSYSAIDET